MSLTIVCEEEGKPSAPQAASGASSSGTSAQSGAGAASVGGRLLVRFYGDIVVAIEAKDFSAVSGAAFRRDVVFDFAAVKRINSVGVRSLLQLCKEVSQKGSLQYRSCVPEVTEQFALLPEFMRYGHVHSILVMESCPTQHESAVRSSPTDRELVVGRDVVVKQGRVVITPRHCTECGCELERLSDDNVALGFLFHAQLGLQARAK